jgi:hypothetical protein
MHNQVLGDSTNQVSMPGRLHEDVENEIPATPVSSSTHDFYSPSDEGVGVYHVSFDDNSGKEVVSAATENGSDALLNTQTLPERRHMSPTSQSVFQHPIEPGVVGLSAFVYSTSPGNTFSIDALYSPDVAVQCSSDNRAPISREDIPALGQGCSEHNVSHDADSAEECQDTYVANVRPARQPPDVTQHFMRKSSALVSGVSSNERLQQPSALASPVLVAEPGDGKAGEEQPLSMHRTKNSTSVMANPNSAAAGERVVISSALDGNQKPIDSIVNSRGSEARASAVRMQAQSTGDHLISSPANQKAAHKARMASAAMGKIAKSYNLTTSAPPALSAASSAGRVPLNEQTKELQTKSRTNEAMPAFAQSSGMQDPASMTPAVSRAGILPAESTQRSVPQVNSYFELQLALQQGDAVTSDSSETELDV